LLSVFIGFTHIKPLKARISITHWQNTINATPAAAATNVTINISLSWFILLTPFVTFINKRILSHSQHKKRCFINFFDYYYFNRKVILWE